MSLHPPDRLRIASAAVVLVLVGLACSGPDREQGVAVRALGTDVGLGIDIGDESPVETVIRRAKRPPPLPKRAPEKFTLEPEGTPIPVREACPAAGPFDFPKEEAGIDNQGRPATDVHTWKYDVTVTNEQGTFSDDVLIGRIVSDVEDDPGIPGAFRFTLSGFVFAESPETASISVRYLVVPASPAQTEQTSADLGEGLYIQALITRGVDENGQPRQSTFEPVPPVLIFPYPAVPGTEIDSTGFDNFGNQLSVKGVVKPKEQLDACGERIDSWLVDGELTLAATNQDNLQREEFALDYDYNVAPQFGSLVVGEEIALPRDDPFLELAARIGEVPKRADEENA